jgi:hypothetical protein
MIFLSLSIVPLWPWWKASLVDPVVQYTGAITYTQICVGSGKQGKCSTISWENSDNPDGIYIAQRWVILSFSVALVLMLFSSIRLLFVIRGMRHGIRPRHLWVAGALVRDVLSFASVLTATIAFVLLIVAFISNDGSFTPGPAGPGNPVVALSVGFYLAVVGMMFILLSCAFLCLGGIRYRKMVNNVRESVEESEFHYVEPLLAPVDTLNNREQAVTTYMNTYNSNMQPSAPFMSSEDPQ